MKSNTAMIAAGYPAWAGIDPKELARSWRFTWLPRVGGDRPGVDSSTPAVNGVTPRGRG